MREGRKSDVDRHQLIRLGARRIGDFGTGAHAGDLFAAGIAVKAFKNGAHATLAIVFVLNTFGNAASRVDNPLGEGAECLATLASEHKALDDSFVGTLEETQQRLVYLGGPFVAADISSHVDDVVLTLTVDDATDLGGIELVRGGKSMDAAFNGDTDVQNAVGQALRRADISIFVEADSSTVGRLTVTKGIVSKNSTDYTPP